MVISLFYFAAKHSIFFDHKLQVEYICKIHQGIFSWGFFKKFWIFQYAMRKLFHSNFQVKASSSCLTKMVCLRVTGTLIKSCIIYVFLFFIIVFAYRNIIFIPFYRWQVQKLGEQDITRTELLNQCKFLYTFDFLSRIFKNSINIFKCRTLDIFFRH